jgi:GMP synthase (glutamine-hydrolysing)
MKTLIVNSYHGNWAQKIRPVQDMVSLSCEYEVANDLDIAPDYDLESFNAVVLSGSPNLISRNEYLPRYVEFLRQLRRPTLGICYGHQLLAHAFGARVIDGAKMLEGYGTIRVLEEAPLFRDMPDEIALLESHREYVAAEDLAQSGFDLMASSATCAVEAMHHTERPLFGVQFHLERSGPNGEQIMSNFFRFARDYKPAPEDE